MRAFLLSILVCLRLPAQDCPPPDTLLPQDSVAGALGEASCRMTDGTPYAPYRLVLPTRGRISLTAGAGTLILRDDHGMKLDAGASITRPIERGVFTVFVFGAAGPYTLRSAFTPEPGTLCRDFPSLGLKQTVAGSLGDASCLTPIGGLYDAYALHTLGGGTLTVTVAAAGFSPAVWLRDDTGRLLASGTDSAAYLLGADSDYTVVVTGSGPGAYQIATQFDAAATCRAVKTLGATEQTSGTIPAAGCGTLDPVSGNPWLFNYYDVAVTETGLADVRVSSATIAPLLVLRDASGREIGADMLSAGARASALRLPLKAGNYTLLVVTADPAGGAYTLAYTFTPQPPRGCAPRGPLALPGTDGGTLSASNCHTADGFGDVYILSPAAPGTVEIDAGSMETDTVAVLRDDKDNVLARAEGTPILADLAPGNYSVTVAAIDGAGSYSVSASFVAAAPGACEQLSIALNGGYVNQFGLGGCRTAAGQPVDYYQFTLPADGMIAAIMTASQIDGYLRLEDSAGNLLRYDDNTYGERDPVILQYLPAGAYRLAAQAVDGGWGGWYRLDLLHLPGTPPVACAPGATLAVDTPVTGNLVFTACQYPDDTFADIYRLEVTDAAGFDIQLHSEVFDTALALLDAQGNVVDSDDNPTGGGDARISRLFAPGTYWVVVKAATDYAAQGPYVLLVKPAQ